MKPRDDFARLELLASAIANRPVRVACAEPGAASWTDGKVVFVAADASSRDQLTALTVQASLLAAGSLERDIMIALLRRPSLTRRYLAVEARRALAALAGLLPPSVSPGKDAYADTDTDTVMAAVSASPAASLALARSRSELPDPPASFGTIRARELLSMRSDATSGNATAAAPVRSQTLIELAEEASEDAPSQDGFVGALAGGGAIGKWLSKLLTAARQLSGGGSPGADAPTHWTRSGRRGTRASLVSNAPSGAAADARVTRAAGTKYPEWDVYAQHYRMDWCTVSEVEPKAMPERARFAITDRTGLRRSLARLGLGIDSFHRQPQGDDIDIDAVIEERVELLAGSAPDEDVFIASVRRRRDLSVLLLLDVSGSVGEPGEGGKTVHELQRAAAAGLTLALHELGDRVALYAYHSQGREAVRLMPIKRFSEDAGPLMLQRLGGLDPGAYSRLGAAIRHGTARLQDLGGTPRQLLVVLSDGLAYDHGYEPAYGAADAQRALAEARSEGVACLCLSIGSSTDHESLRKVFGKAAHAALPTPKQLSQVIGPLFRSALRSADVRRRVS